MTLFVGVPSSSSLVLSNLKQAALLFDFIALQADMNFYSQLYGPKYSEIDYLWSIGFIVERPELTDDLILNDPDLIDIKRIFVNGDYPKDFHYKDNKERKNILRAIKVRGACSIYQKLYGWDAVPIVYDNKESIITKGSEAVISVVLNGLPVPDESTPWGQIMDFRQDKINHGKFLALKVWMNEVARSGLKKGEII